MRVRREGEGDVFIGSHIPGPWHNWLKLHLEKGRSDADFTPVGRLGHLEPVPSYRRPTRAPYQPPPPLAPEEVKAWILDGVRRANAALGTDYGVVRAEFVFEDSRRPEVYAAFAQKMVMLAHAGGNGGA